MANFSVLAKGRRPRQEHRCRFRANGNFHVTWIEAGQSNEQVRVFGTWKRTYSLQHAWRGKQANLTPKHCAPRLCNGAQRDIQVNVNMCKACHNPVHSNNKTQQRSQFYVFFVLILSPNPQIHYWHVIQAWNKAIFRNFIIFVQWFVNLWERQISLKYARHLFLTWISFDFWAE